MKQTVLITGGAGYLGSKVVRRLSQRNDLSVVCCDLRDVDPSQRLDDVIYATADVRGPEMVAVIKQHKPEIVIHLAAIVDPGQNSTREFEYSVDVEGTQNVLDACLDVGVRRFITTSSGAAYGYYPDHPEWLTEDDPIRGNYEFAYAYHKRLVEEMLAELRDTRPELEQVIFRVGTILGKGVNNQITNLFEKSKLVSIRGADDRFVMVWDEDVAGCLEHAVDSTQTGIFNVAGDGAVSMAELAKRMGKPYVRLPALLVKAVLAIGKPLGLTRYGPEQVRFIQYRPVLSNRRLKEVFGYVPEKSSLEVFEYYLEHR